MRMFNFLKWASPAAALVVFVACTLAHKPLLADEEGDARMGFTVLSAADGSPVKGVAVRAYESWSDVAYTDEAGCCEAWLHYRRNVEGPTVSFVDPSERFVSKDTVLADLRFRNIVVKLVPVE